METQQTSASVHPVSRRLSFDTAAAWALALTGALAAIAIIPFGSVSFVYTKVFVISLGGLIALALYILARLTRGNVILPPVTMLGALWLVPLAYALSALFSGRAIAASFFGTQLESDTFGFIVLLAVLASLSALAFRRTEQYQAFYLVGSIGVALVALAQLGFLVASFIVPTAISATVNLVGSFADLGLLTGLALVVALVALRLLDVSYRRRLALYIGGGIGLLILALVNSSLVWAPVALVAFGLFIEAIMRRTSTHTDADFDAIEPLSDTSSNTSDESMRMLVPSLVVLAFSLFFLIGGSTIGSALGGAFGTGTLDVRPSWQSTFAVGSQVYGSSPVFGTGPNTFAEQWNAYRDRSINDTVFWNIDFVSGIGWIPTSFVTTGALGALAWLAFLGLFLYVGLRFLLFSTPADTYLRFVAASSFVASVYLFTISLFSVPGPVVLAAGFLFVGLFVSSTRFSEMRRERGIVFARNPRLGFVIVFGFTLLLLGSVGAAYVMTERYVADIFYNGAVASYSAGDLDAALASANRSAVFVPADRTYRLVSLIGMGNLGKIANDSTLSADSARTAFQAALSQSVESALTATQIGPNDYRNWVMLGNVYQAVVPLDIQGAYDNAKSAYEHALMLTPTNATIPFTLAQLEIAHKDNAAAEKELNAAIDLKHDYTQAIFLLSQIQVAQGRAREALQAAEAAAYFAPNDPAVLFQVGILRSGTGDADGAIAALAHAVELNPQYANARFFLAVAYATKKEYEKALAELQAVAALSPENEKALAPDIATLSAGKNPFPASRLGALGIPQPVQEGTTGGK